MGQFMYEAKCVKHKGFFNIYQSKSGHIFLIMGNSPTRLTHEQVCDLGINIFSLEDFDHDDYLAAYSLS